VSHRLNYDIPLDWISFTLCSIDYVHGTNLDNPDLDIIVSAFVPLSTTSVRFITHIFYKRPVQDDHWAEVPRL
jgi:hypothetical protein